MRLLGHYEYMTVPFFTVDLIVESFSCGNGEYSLFSFGGPSECEGNYNAERCMTNRTIADTMSCRGMSEVVLRSLYQCSHWPGGSPCSHIPAYTLFASKVWLSKVLTGTRLLRVSLFHHTGGYTHWARCCTASLPSRPLIHQKCATY